MRQRSSYPKPFKAQVVQECLQPGATISSVAIHHGYYLRPNKSGNHPKLVPLVATDLPGSIACNLAGFRSGKHGTKTSIRRDGDHLAASGR
jgi:hypothetical protein